MKAAPLVAMFALAGIASVVLLLSLSTPKAEAAKPYCGHAYRTYIRDLPMGPTVFRIAYRWGSLDAQHLHHYAIFRLRTGYTNKWVFVKSLDRTCLNTHPV